MLVEVILWRVRWRNESKHQVLAEMLGFVMTVTIAESADVRVEITWFVNLLSDY